MILEIKKKQQQSTNFVIGEIQIKSHSQFRAIFVNQWDDSDSTADDSWWSKRARAFDSVCLERRRREISRSLSMDIGPFLWFLKILEFKLQRKYRIKYHHETVFWNHKNQDNSYFVDADSAVRHKQCSDEIISGKT